MHRLSVLFGCCLLWVTTAGCAGEVRPVPESAAVAASNEQATKLVAQAATRAGQADVTVHAVEGGASGDCALFAAAPNNALPAISTIYALLGGDRVVAPGEPNALERVLDACGDDAGAALWAQAVVAFAPGIPRGRVAMAESSISSTAHKWAMRDGGYAFHPPRLQDAAGGKAVEFFMTDVEGDTLYQVRATRSNGGSVVVDAKPAGKG